MIDPKLIKEKPDVILTSLVSRGYNRDEAIELVDTLTGYDKERRIDQKKLEDLLSQRKKQARLVHKLKSTLFPQFYENAKEDARKINDQIDNVKNDMDHKLCDYKKLFECLPNILLNDVPSGIKGGAHVIGWHGKMLTPAFSFKPRDHVDIGERLNILDFKRAAKMSGARFVLYKNYGAKMERALINMMLNYHSAAGYEEVLPPFLVNAKALFGTGNLPKFEQDLFSLREYELYLIPTAEVPVTNIHMDEVIPEGELPKKYVAYTPCFRSEAGAHGKDTRGIIRQHQFNKVELVKIVKPEDGLRELRSLLRDAENILEELKLPYRVRELCADDVGFASAKTFDIEVWMPARNEYVEISSCSWFTDFQARRAKIRYKPSEGGKPRLVHTINGSGLAIGRTVAAILENYQEEDGSVEVPEVLRPFMQGTKQIVSQ